MRSLSGWLLALTSLIIPVSLAQSPDATEEAGTTPQHAMRLALEAANEAAPYAIYDGGEITEGELLMYHSRNSLYQLPQEWGRGRIANSLAEDLTWRERGCEELAEALSEVEEWDLEGLDTQLNEIALLALVRQNAILQVQTTEEDLRRTYEENLIEFALPFQFWMRTLFLSCYEEHTVASGETPTSIAIAIGDDPLLALDIRDARHRRLLEPWQASPERIDLICREIRVGETLRVPIGSDGRAAVRERLEALAEEIDSPESFIAIAREHSESEPNVRGEELGPLPRGDIPNFLPELLQVGIAQPLNTASDIIETKHGFQIVMVTRRQMNEYEPFEAVRDRVERMARAELEAQATREWMLQIIEDAGGEIVEVEGVVTFPDIDALDHEMRLATTPDGEDITVAMHLEDFRNLPAQWRTNWFSRPHVFLLRNIIVKSDILDHLMDEPGNEWVRQIVEFDRVIRVTNDYERLVINTQALEVTRAMLEERYQADYASDESTTFIEAEPRLRSLVARDRHRTLRNEMISGIMEGADFQITGWEEGEDEEW